MDGMLAEQYPGFVEQFSPRRYESVGPYVGTRDIGLRMAMSVITSTTPGLPKDDPTDIVTLTSLKLSEIRVPTFFVAPDFFRAAVASKTPDMTWADVQWPVDAILFMVPRGVLNSPADGPVEAIAVARHAKGPVVERGHPRLMPFQRDLPEARVSYVAFTQNFASFSGHNQLDRAITDLVPGNLSGLVMTDENGDPVFDTLTPAESDFLSSISSLCARLLLLSSARGDLIQRETLKRKGTLGPKGKSELWAPNIIGAKYRLPCHHDGEAGSRHGRRPRMHLRWGHIRNQRHGPGLTLVKTRWIEPMWVAVDSGSADAEALSS